MREPCPRDFYWFSLVENDFPDLDQQVKLLLIIALLTDAGEEVLDLIPMRFVGPLSWWIVKNILEEKIMKVEAWLELAYHLQKQRWDESIDWLEGQPVIKVQWMAEIQKNFVEKQNQEMKKNSRKK